MKISVRKTCQDNIAWKQNSIQNYYIWENLCLDDVTYINIRICVLLKDIIEIWYTEIHETFGIAMQPAFHDVHVIISETVYAETKMITSLGMKVFILLHHSFGYILLILMLNNYTISMRGFHSHFIAISV